MTFGEATRGETHVVERRTFRAERLIERARRKGRVRHGAGRNRIALEGLDLVADGGDLDLLALDEALDHLGEKDPHMHRVVMLRFFAGLSEEQAAKVIGVSDRTVRRDWTVARAWLHRELNTGRAPDEEPPSTPDP